MKGILQSLRLTNDVCDKARARAYSIAERAIAEDHERDTRGLSGHAGDALLFWACALATGESRYENALHASLKRAALLEEDLSIGLFGGMSGLRAVAELATSIEPRYGRLVEQCDAFVEARLPREPEQPRTYSLFDVMEGWAGIRLSRFVNAPGTPDRLTTLLRWLLEDRAHWTCPHPVTDPGLPISDLGVAHGIAGVLAAVVLTHDELGAGLRDHIRNAAHLLASSRIDGARFTTWPHSLGRPDNSDQAAAWCYGAPGIAAALHAVARALDDTSLAAFTLDAALDVAARTPEDWIVHETGLCHGLLGNALCFASVAWTSGSRLLWERVVSIARIALDRLEHEECVLSDELRGGAGIALALLTLCGDVPPVWMRLHALEAP